mgnify:FL=1
MGKEKKYISQAVAALAKAQAAMSDRLDRHEKIIDSQAQEIAELSQQVLSIRNAAIKTDLDAGLSGREVAQKYQLSPGRVSQIKNSN